jgi:hypothetical protein
MYGVLDGEPPFLGKRFYSVTQSWVMTCLTGELFHVTGKDIQIYPVKDLHRFSSSDAGQLPRTRML